MKSFISCSVKYEKPSHHPKAFFVRVKKVDAGLSCILYFGILNLYFVFSVCAPSETGECPWHLSSIVSP